MSAAELATIVEGWATLAGLMVVVAGAVFAGVQLRQEAKARHLQAILAVLSDIRPPEINPAQYTLMSLPDGFGPSDLSKGALDDVTMVMASYGRLGTLLAMGMVEERDIFRFPALSGGAIEVWEKVKHVARADAPGTGMGTGLNAARYIELLAGRAQAYIERKGLSELRSIPTFDADPGVLETIGSRLAQVRAGADPA
ncbi:MAG: hypothetical protein IH869_01465 [Chloroflexi bacterium]|nr:hypothetical protein [Chloroflexota bacterium]